MHLVVSLDAFHLNSVQLYLTRANLFLVHFDDFKSFLMQVLVDLALCLDFLVELFEAAEYLFEHIVFLDLVLFVVDDGLQSLKVSL